ncbi:MAG: cyclic pyranopterin monophosphate synthase MoaC [Nitrospirota bacterium]|jgi:cyclic pyranopterin phosphate synthase
MAKLTHLDARGRARMVDVSSKPSTVREARASASVLMKKETLSLLRQGRIPKGDVIATARVAGIMAAKKTPELIPLCHPLDISSVEVDLKAQPTRGRVLVTTKVVCTGQTGVEMEALTAAAVAALTVYDMCKAVDREMTISEVVLLEKRGGRSGEYRRKK